MHIGLQTDFYRWTNWDKILRHSGNCCKGTKNLGHSEIMMKIFAKIARNFRGGGKRPGSKCRALKTEIMLNV